MVRSSVEIAMSESVGMKTGAAAELGAAAVESCVGGSDGDEEDPPKTASENILHKLFSSIEVEGRYGVVVACLENSPNM